jgi:hypothetical protein
LTNSTWHRPPFQEKRGFVGLLDSGQTVATDGTQNEKNNKIKTEATISHATGTRGGAYER